MVFKPYLEDRKDSTFSLAENQSKNTLEEQRYIKVKLIHKSEEGIEIVSFFYFKGNCNSLKS